MNICKGFVGPRFESTFVDATPLILTIIFATCRYNIPSRDFGKDNRTAQWDGCAAAIEDFAREARLSAGACHHLDMQT